MNLGILKYIFILIGLIYFFSPVDLIPDVLGLLGRLDDILVVAFLIWQYSIKLKRYKEQLKFYQERLRQEHGSDNTEERRTGEGTSDPYEVLEIKAGASEDEIQSAYKKLMGLYHPDKVNHLGAELKDLAHKKTLQIQRAYEALQE